MESNFKPRRLSSVVLDHILNIPTAMHA